MFNDDNDHDDVDVVVIVFDIVVLVLVVAVGYLLEKLNDAYYICIFIVIIVHWHNHSI